jgi:L-aspartate oxidase
MMAPRLLAPEPGWTRQADVVVVGSGVAGVTAVLAIRRRLPDARILLATKSVLDDGSTRWAQGGVAAALGPEDSPQQHLEDTLTAGAGICDVRAVRALVTDGPEAVRRLIALGAEFDREPSGPLALTREGGHHRRRIAHAGGDATGAEISRALLVALEEAGHSGELEVIEHALAIDLLLAPGGRAAGISLHVLGQGQADGVGAVHARAVVLATGGFGQIYAATTNPPVSTGDGVALAMRAGAEVADLEFVQFHPTVLWLGPGSLGRQPLISEAVRGEGAVLVTAAGHRFMTGQHPQADLAPRDVVAKAIMREMMAAGTDHVYLDGRELGAEAWQHRFPTIAASCREHGIDPVTELVPVVPAAHYVSGGVRTDLHGRTTVPGLYACGEVACTGVHGANRLASNSLLEGLVFAERIAAVVAAELTRTEGIEDPQEPDQGSFAALRPSAPPGSSGSTGGQPVLLDPGIVGPLQQLMSASAGVLRSGAGLAAAASGLAELGLTTGDKPGADAWQATNLHLIATALVKAALVREETRGSHWREDFGQASEMWRGHLAGSLDSTGFGLVFEPVLGE